MRASPLIATVAVTATAGAIWYFGATPLPVDIRRAETVTKAARSAKEALSTGVVPQELTAFAIWLKSVPLEQRDQFIRERVLSLSVTKAEDRKHIRAFLLSGADVEIEHPGHAAVPFSGGKTSLRRHFLGLLDEFPAEEAIPLAKEMLTKTSDFREAHLSLRALEHHQPDANRSEALQAMQRLLPSAVQPAKSGRETERFLAQYDKFAEPIAHYQLTELHPVAMQAVKANPFLAGRYSEAIESFPPTNREAAYDEIFAQPVLATELVNGVGTRSVNLWLDTGFRQRLTNFYATRMNDAQRLSLLTSLGEDTGIHYTGKPLAEPKNPSLQPTDPAADLGRAKARQTMLDELAPHSTKPILKETLEESKASVSEEIKSLGAPAPARRFSPVELPVLDPLGKPAGAPTTDPAPPSEPVDPTNPPSPVETE